MNEDDESVENAMSLSFLDVISCGMVSSIFLAIIFSVIGHMPAISLKTEEFIAVLLELNYKSDNTENANAENANSDSSTPENADNSTDCQVWNLALKTPSMPSGQLEYLKTEHYNLETGRYVERMKDVENEVEENINTKIQLFGFNSLTYSGKSAGKFRIFFISKPEHGKWRLKIAPKDADDTNPDLKKLKKIHIITSNTEVQTYDYSQPEKCGKEVQWEPDGVNMYCTFDFK